MNDRTRKKKNSLLIQVPFSFIREKVNSLTWRELQYGIFTGYTSKQTAIEYAIATISSSEDSKSLHFQLASLYNSELSLVENLLTQIVKEEALQNENEMKRKWVYLMIFLRILQYSHLNCRPATLSSKSVGHSIVTSCNFKRMGEFQKEGTPL